MTAPMVLAAILAAPPAPLTLRFDEHTGAWTGIRAGRTEIVAGVSQDLEVSWEGGALLPFEQWKLVRMESAPNRCTVIRRAGDWEFQSVSVTEGGVIRRRAVFRWTGKAPVMVNSVVMRTPELKMGDGRRTWTLVPGNYPIRRDPVADMTPGTRVTESGWTRGEYGVALMHSPVSRLSVAAAYAFEHDQARVAVVRTPRGAVLEHRFDTLARLDPGQEVAVGEQVISVIHGDERALRSDLADLSTSIGNGPPSDRPADVGQTVLYEVHPWGRLESWSEGDRGHRYDRLAQLMPYYRRLGVNTLWLLPVSWPPPWVYTLPAFDRIAPENGTPDQLRGLIGAAHANGINVLADLVVYGIHPEADEVKRLPDDVWCRDREGRPVRVWGGTVLAADTSIPAWQARIREVADHWGREFGFDGARLDCIGWGQTQNWASPRPNAAIAYGGLQLNKVVRDAFRAANPRSLLLPEGGKPLVFRNADLIFDYPLYLAMRDLTLTADLPRGVSDLQAWLQWERLCYPKGALAGMVRFLELHDTVAAAEYFGVGPSQALLAACIFMEGVPLLQQEQEVGFSADVARWLALRNRERCFTHGAARYQDVRVTDPRLLTFMREAEDAASVVAINLTGAPIRSSVRWPSEIARRFPVAYDGLSGAPVSHRGGSAFITVPPFRPFVILLRPRGARPTPTDPQAPTPGARTWEVRTSEGVLADSENDYAARLRPGEQVHDVLPTLRRAFKAADLGLMDGVVPPSVNGGPVTATVDPWFVEIENRWVRLVLARRHGGVIAELARVEGSRRVTLIGPGGDAYADQGFFPDRLYGSADGETNPRLQFERHGDAVVVRFRGLLRRRAWNGVQTCAVAPPPLEYTLTYTMDATAVVRVAMELSSETERHADSAFFAMRTPLAGFAGWSRGDAGGKAGASTGVRLGHEAPNGDPLVVHLREGEISVKAGPGVRRLFVIDSGGAASQLFVALADGTMPALAPGKSVRAEVTLAVQRPGGAGP